MRKITYSILLLLLSVSSAFGQIQMEDLNHGLVAIKTNTGTYVSWRVPAAEYNDVSYNIYRDGTKLNPSPIFSKSNYTDKNGTVSSSYEIKTVIKGVEQNTGETATVWDKNYLEIPVRAIDGSYSKYELNDASVGDLDGDGEYEIVVKRLNSENSITGTDYHYLEAYEMDGTFMWAINMGPNIFNKVEFNFLVWDFDGDGKAEIALRTSEEFTDALGNTIGDIDGDGKTNYRSSVSWVNYRQEGPDFLSIINGETGKEITRATYIPRGKITDWGKNDGAHRSTKCMYTPAYLDGKHPSIVISRGIYERTALAAWDFDGTNLTQRWYFDSNTSGNGDYAQQGFHNLTQGDVDNDGRDEIVYGSMCIDDDGTGLYSTRLGHGDAQHLTDINPERKGLEYFGCLENKPQYGGSYRDAATGETIYQQGIGRDMGRAGCSDITASYPGMEMWGASGFSFLSATGEVIENLKAPSSMNFFIWWDGDPLREFLDHSWNGSQGTGTITKYNNGQNTRLLTATGSISNNWTKGTPCLSADILGDWREEVIWRSEDNSALRLYTTTYASDIKMYTLMHNPQYRAAIGWQQNSYNQPPHPSFFIGHDMDSIPPSPQLLPGQKVWVGGAWDASQVAWQKDNIATSFQNGDPVLFDISGDNNTNITLSGTLMPSEVRVIAPIDYVFDGEGTIAGNGTFTKAGSGSLTINNNASYTGLTRIWDGQLILNGHLSNSTVLAKRFTTVGGIGHFGNGLSIEKLANLMIGTQAESANTLSISKHLTLADESTIHFDLSDDASGNTKGNDIIILNGDLNWSKTTFQCKTLDQELGLGDYVLCSISGTTSGDIDDITIKGLEGELFELIIENKKLILRVSQKRAASSIEWQGNKNNVWDLISTRNWINAGTPDYFREDDQIIINDKAVSQEIEIIGNYPVSSVLVQASKNISIIGSGAITGDASFTKEGSGKFTINNLNSYTGTTTISQGILSISKLSNGTTSSNLGKAGSEPSKLSINGGQLEITGGSSTSDKGLTIGSNDAILAIRNTNTTQSIGGVITGGGVLIKKGEGTLGLSNSNTYSGGTIIEEGTISMLSDVASDKGFGSGVVTINNGTIIQHDSKNSSNSSNNKLYIPKSGLANYILDSRIYNRDSIFGDGELNLTINDIRTDFEGDWSSFEGKINVLTDADGGEFRVNNSYGYASSKLHLSAKVTARHLTKDTVRIGELSGDISSKLIDGTWEIGALGTNALFEGSITSAKLIKKGSGRLTLNGNTSFYTGGTLVEQGALWLTNTSGISTGIGTIQVKSNATLGGNGFTNCDIVIEKGAYLAPGDDLGTFTTLKAIQFNQGSLISFDIDIENAKNDQIAAKNIILGSPIIFMNNISASSYGIGEQFRLFSATEISGEIGIIYPKQPGNGMYWDTRELKSKGIIKVTDEIVNAIGDVYQLKINVHPTTTSDIINIEITDAPSNDIETKLYNQSGQEVSYSSHKTDNNSSTLNISHLNQGIYFLEVRVNNSRSIHKICKK